MYLAVYDTNIKWKGVIDDFTKLQWNRRHFKPGDFSLTALANENSVTLLKKGNLIWKHGDKDAGYITDIGSSVNDDGEKMIIANGRHLLGYFDRRIPDTEYVSGAAETKLREFAMKYLISPADTARAIPRLVLAPAHGYTKEIQYQVVRKEDKYVSDAMADMGQLAALGQRIIFDPYGKQLLYDVYSGVNRTAGQNINPVAIFSVDFDNTKSQEYTDSDADLKNVVIVEGQYEWEYQTPVYDESGNPVKDSNGNVKTQTAKASKILTVTIGNAAGIDRREIFIDGGNNEIDGGGYLSEADFLTALISKGNTVLKERITARAFNSTIDANSNLVYKTDFDLGDMVTCVNKEWGIQLDTQITEIQEIYENQGVTVNVTFGNDTPTLLEKIKRIR